MYWMAWHKVDGEPVELLKRKTIPGLCGPMEVEWTEPPFPELYSLSVRKLHQSWRNHLRYRREHGT